MAQNTVSRRSNTVFSQVAEVNIPRSVFNLSSTHKTTLNSGKIYPIYYRDVVAGDTFNLQTNSLVRLATPLTPFMDNIYVDIHYFFVPHRLVWDGWEDFFSGKEDYTVPKVSRPSGGYDVESIYDYFGLPINVNLESTEAFRFRGYNAIWNDFYRDQNLQPDEIPVPKGHGTDDSSLYKLKRRGKRHDYFTSCLPFPQKGDPVSISMGNLAPVTIDATNTFKSIAVDNNWDISYGEGTNVGLNADLSQAESITIDDFTHAVAIQHFLQKDARYGSRYIEQLRAHFGVKSSDARLQRPEYLGGGSQPVVIQPVPQQSASNDVSPQGNLGAYGLSTGHYSGFIKSFEEHGTIMALASIRADMTYQQGLDREVCRKTRYDFYFPSFAHLGEQAVLNKEIVCRGNTADDDVFGYQERYAEMRFGRNIITGKMRSSFSNSTHQSFDMWHLGLKFADSNNIPNHPSLNEDFIEERPPISRVIAVQDEPEFIADFWFTVKATRPLPTYSIPNLVPRI